MSKDRVTSLVTALVAGAVIFGLYRFQAEYHEYHDYLVTNVAALLWVPMLSVMLILRREPDSFGFGLGDMRRGMRLAAVLYVAVLPFLIYASTRSDFRQYYPIQKWAGDSLYLFAYFELTYGMYLFCWEFFFRGFTLFGLSRSLGGLIAVLAQAAGFGLLHLGKPPQEVLASFGAGIILGFLALRSKSFLPCFVVHWAAAFTFDVLIILGKRRAF